MQNEIAIAGVIDLGTVETFPVFRAAQRGLIDQDTCHVLLETQLIMGGLLQPDSPVKLSLEQALTRGLIDSHTRQSLSELESALYLVENTKTVSDEQQENALPVVRAMETGLIREEVGLRILQLQMNTGGLRHSTGKMLSLEQAEDKRLLSPRIITKLQSRLQHRELIDPNTAEKVHLCELQLQCVLDDDSGLLLFPVKQHPGGTVCLRSGRKVGIFRAVQEGLIDRKVTVRLLEAQLFAGGIADPRSGHRLTVDEAVRHGLMDQDLACAMLARQLQNGGILDPFNGERLDLEESIRRDLLSTRLALLVLESLWTFMGLLWPETGEVLPIAEAVQQGVISGDLARSTLRQRHAIGALYNPETLQVLPLNSTAENELDPSAVSFLKEIHIPDVLSNMNQSGNPSLNRHSWGSTSSSSPPSSPLPPSSPTGLVWETTSTNGKNPEEQAKHKLLFHLMTHSYVDAHSGKRLVLLDPELMIMIKDADMVAGESARQVEPLSSMATDKLDKLEMGEKISWAGNGVSEGVNDSSSLVTPSKDFEINDRSGLEEMHDGEGDNKSLQQPSEPIEEDLAISAKYEIAGDKSEKVDEQKKEMTSWDSLASAKYLNDEIAKSPNEIIQTEYQPMDSPVRDSGSTTATEVIEMATAPLKSEDNVERKTFKELIPEEKPNEDVNLTASQERKDIKHSQAESEIIKQNVAVKETDSKQAKPQVDVSEEVAEKQEEDAELERLVVQLKQGGLMTEEGEKLLPDEAVAQGVLPGHTAVKLMAQAGLFGGFLDASSGESLTMEEVMQEGLLDEDLMWGVLKSDKTLAGVVDVEKRQICGVREAAQAGLIDPNTASRLLEAQVASGGIVDLRRDKKVSVTLAANLGLIEDDHREELVALEKACKGKDADSSTFLKKASLQLQMEGVLDPESKSPVPIEQAIHKGLIRPEEAYQVLARQVAEGGIIHHPSGMRLPVSDAVDRGLVDRSVAPGLEELEWVYQGKVSPSRRPEAFVFQASTGAISDPDTGIKLTLTEAVTKGLLDENKASEVMASPTVTQGVLDPQTARIVPYSELVNLGKIDIETGKRFLEVKPFRGVQDKQSNETLTLPEAVALKKVDPAPALRLLQSQADSGGIIDIRTGERLSLPEASKRGLVGDDMVTEIATNQFLKGGLVDPSTGQRVSSLNVATALGLISNNVALEIQEKVMSVETEGGEKSSTPVASSDSTYSPAIKFSASSPDSPSNWSDVNTEAMKSPPSKREAVQDEEKTLTSVLSDQLKLYDTIADKDKVDKSESGKEKSSRQPDESMDILFKFATNVEKRIQQAIKEIEPQKDTTKSQSLPEQEADERLQINDEQRKSIIRDSVGEVKPTQIYHADKDLKKEDRTGVNGEPVQGGEKERVSEDGRLKPKMTSPVAVMVIDDKESKEGDEVSNLGEEESRKDDVAVQKDDGIREKVQVVEKEKPLKVEDLEIKTSTCSEESAQLLASASKESENKSKKKRKNKKKGKGKETESETHPSEIKHASQIYQTEEEMEGKSGAVNATTVELASQDVDMKSQIHGQGASEGPIEGIRTDGKFEVESNLVKRGQKEALKLISEPEKEANKILTATGKADKREEMKGKPEEKDSVAQQPEKPESIQEVKGRKEHELPQKSPLPDTEKAALILKAKESILKKVFEKSVSEKQAAEELQALRKEVGKKEGKGITVSDVKAQTRHAKEDGVESRAVKEDTVKTSDSLSEESKEEEMSVQVDKMKLREVKENLPVEKPLVEETTEAEPLEASSNEKEKDASFGMEETQKDIKTAASVQSKETRPSKQSKKSKKSKRLKVAEKAEPDTEKALSKEKVEVTATEITPKSTLERTDLESSGLIQEQKVDAESRSPTGDVLSPSAGEETVEVETPEIIVPTFETLEQTSPHFYQPQRLSYHVQDIVQAEEISGGKDKSHSGTGGVIESSDLYHDEHKVETTALSAALSPAQSTAQATPVSHAQSTAVSTAQPTASDPQPDKTAGKGRKKKKHQPVKEEGSDTPASESLKNQQQHLESSQTPALLSEDAAAESESAVVPQSETTTETWAEDDASESPQEETSSVTGKARGKLVKL